MTTEAAQDPAAGARRIVLSVTRAAPGTRLRDVGAGPVRLTRAVRSRLKAVS